jgi:hypothetical protein
MEGANFTPQQKAELINRVRSQLWPRICMCTTAAALSLGSLGSP